MTIHTLISCSGVMQSKKDQSKPRFWFIRSPSTFKVMLLHHQNIANPAAASTNPANAFCSMMFMLTAAPSKAVGAAVPVIGVAVANEVVDMPESAGMIVVPLVVPYIVALPLELEEDVGKTVDVATTELAPRALRPEVMLRIGPGSEGVTERETELLGLVKLARLLTVMLPAVADELELVVAEVETEVAIEFEISHVLGIPSTSHRVRLSWTWDRGTYRQSVQLLSKWSRMPSRQHRCWCQCRWFGSEARSSLRRYHR